MPWLLPSRRNAPASWVAVLALATGAAPAYAAHPRALWHVVHDLCVPDTRLLGLAAPCLSVDLQQGYAVVPDPGNDLDLLIVPTARVSGIEDPQLLAPGTPNFWRLAWRSRWRLQRRLGRDLPRQAVGMAVNAVAGRSQDQLHIHLSCVRADVVAALDMQRAGLSEHWAPVAVASRRWRARFLKSDDLSGADPFKLLDQDPEAVSERGRETLVVIGAELPDHEPGFYLLHRASDPATGYAGHGERLLDETCGGGQG